MKPQRLLNLILLGFIAASIGTLAVRQWRRSLPPSAGQSATAQAETVPAMPGQVCVLCFHNTVRCSTCNKLEAYTREMLQQSFARRLADGRIRWSLVDIQQPEHEHFRNDYQLVGPSIVLVAPRGAQSDRWENLADAVPLVDDKPRYVQYVREHVQAFIDAATP
ncbi:MAG: nitrophenyl compound nitroreductase subunit ArsF family protein [Thermoguttaceae bacterium]|jgi:hypothetical protein